MDLSEYQGGDFEAAILRGVKMLDLKEDWDDEGAIPIKKNIFDKAVNFLCLHIPSYLSDKVNLLPGRNSEVMLHIKSEFFEVLIDFGASDLAHFYADNYSTLSVKGTIRLNEECANLMMELFTVLSNAAYN